MCYVVIAQFGGKPVAVQLRCASCPFWKDGGWRETIIVVVVQNLRTLDVLGDF
jgi:hypothetical protein